MKRRRSYTPPARFQVSNLVRLNRFLPPVLSGSIVTILDVHQVGGGCYRYQVQSTEYPEKPVWASEEDLAAPLDPGLSSTGVEMPL